MNSSLFYKKKNYFCHVDGGDSRSKNDSVYSVIEYLYLMYGDEIWKEVSKVRFSGEGKGHEYFKDKTPDRGDHY